MREYVIYRHGWDESAVDYAGGESEKRCVFRVEAHSPEEACQIAQSHVRLGDGQHLSAEPADTVDAQEHSLNLKVEALDWPQNL